MKAYASLSILLVLVLAAACAPLPPVAPATPVPLPSRTAEPGQPSTAGWQTYTNPAGFSIRYPETWKQAELAPTSTSQGASVSGPEGTVELWWGTGFGGACPQGYTTVKVSDGELPACYSVAADGTQHWEQINKQLATTSFSGRAYTNDATTASANAVLAVIATLAFEEPATQGIANPASQNCVAKGGTLKIEERGDGGQIGVCYFEDNLQCEEWALMREECPVGGVKVTGYTTEAGRYCAITGGVYAATANSGQSDEQGTCTLPNGVQCDATAYYNGTCDASTGAKPTPSSATIVPPTAEVCNGMAQVLSQALLQANTQHANVEVTQSDQPVAMTDLVTGAQGTGCRATGNGNGEQFASPDAVMQQVSAVLTGGGWTEEQQQTASGGATGEGWGFRSGDLVAYASAYWEPAASANCAQDQPISACNVTPAQQLYTITLDTGQETTQTVVQGAAAAAAATGNPATQNCINQGGTPKTETRPDGGQYGVCYFGDNYVCEQWALMHGECPVGGVKVTGYNTPAARYCAITGGTYTVTGTTNTGQEAGSCALPGGTVCDADAYYNGTCGSSSPQPLAPTATPAPIGKPNPASQYCTSVGGTLKIETRGDGGQYGVCYFADNKQCEEWALEQGTCPVGGVKVTGYNTSAARYCAITGGQYAAMGTTPDGQEDGKCYLPNGEVCGVWQYYNGYCGS